MEQTGSKADLGIFAIFDTKGNTYRTPIFAMNEWDVLRDYERMCLDPESRHADLVTHAEDFQLFSIGAYVKCSGELLTWLPRHVASLHQVQASLNRKGPPRESVNLKRAEQLDAQAKGLTQ